MLLKILRPIVISIVIMLVVALILVFTQRPKEMSGEGGLDFTRQLEGTGVEPAPLQSVPMRYG